MTKTRTNEFTENRLYMALDLGGSTWKVGFARNLGAKPRIVSIPARSLQGLEAEIKKAKRHFGMAESTPVLSCYEAGRDGFWLHRHLVEQGIDNVVVEPASVAVERRARNAKSDRLDTEKLLRHLIRSQDDPKEWRVVRVPSVEDEDQRHLHRELESLNKRRTAQTNRIKGLLMTQGKTLPVNSKFLENLAALHLPRRLTERLRREYELRQVICEQMRDLRRERRELIRHGETPMAQKARRLTKLKGIGETSALVFSSELFSWRELRNRREVGSLLGLTPTPYNSDGIKREQGISKAGLRHVRSLAVEIAWCWLRFQPRSQLSRWFQRRFGAGRRSRKVGIVALARKLMVALWRYVEHGIVPEGAVLVEA